MSEEQKTSQFLKESGDKYMLEAIVMKPSTQGYRKDENSPWAPKSYLVVTPAPESWKAWVTTGSIKNASDIDFNNRTTPQKFEIGPRQVALLKAGGFFTGDKPAWAKRREATGRKPRTKAEPKPSAKMEDIISGFFNEMMDEHKKLAEGMTKDELEQCKKSLVSLKIEGFPVKDATMQKMWSVIEKLVKDSGGSTGIGAKGKMNAFRVKFTGDTCGRIQVLVLRTFIRKLGTLSRYVAADASSVSAVANSLTIVDKA